MKTQWISVDVGLPVTNIVVWGWSPYRPDDVFEAFIDDYGDWRENTYQAPRKDVYFWCDKNAPKPPRTKP